MKAASSGEEMGQAKSLSACPAARFDQSARFHSFSGKFSGLPQVTRCRAKRNL
jgi:hypothetical protein